MCSLRAAKTSDSRSTWELTPPGSGFSSVASAPDGKLALATYDDFGFTQENPFKPVPGTSYS